MIWGRPGGFLDHLYRYPFASTLKTPPGQSPRLCLATTHQPDAGGEFFQGQILDPARTAAALRFLGKLARTRFFVPPSMLTRILAQADPVVTVGGGLLRFEAFSACCGAYARLDLEETAYEAQIFHPGITHVDFGPDLRTALSGVHRNQSLLLAVGAESLGLTRGGETIWERRVQLPTRWLRSFLEVQTIQSRMVPALEVSRNAALRFIREIPTQPGRGPVQVVSAGRGLRLARRASPDGLSVSGIERLRILADLVPLGRGMRVYRDPEGGSTAWELDLETQRLTLVLSPSRSRGFSGEGGVLRSLARGSEEGLARIRAALTWGEIVLSPELAERAAVSPEHLPGALAALGTRGLLGYDLARGAWFHRPLPFSLELVEGLHPRLQAARALISSGEIALTPQGRGWSAQVPAREGFHRVSVEDRELRCTCPWHARTQGAQGPCKHVLAVELMLEESEGEE